MVNREMSSSNDVVTQLIHGKRTKGATSNTVITGGNPMTGGKKRPKVTARRTRRSSGVTVRRVPGKSKIGDGSWSQLRTLNGSVV